MWRRALRDVLELVILIGIVLALGFAVRCAARSWVAH